MLRDFLKLGVILESRAYEDGRRAFQAGQDETANPYAADTRLRSDWRMGWREASRMEAANRNAEIARKHPDKSAFGLGAAAAAEGLSPRVNPYHFGNPLHEQWRLGWVSRQAA